VSKFQKKKIIIGTWSLSGDYGLIEKKKVIECLTCCVENGFIEFDTAPNYGNGFIYKILSDFKKKSNKKIKINTKCGYDDNLKSKNFSLSSIKKSVENSLDYFGEINCLLLHNPRNEISNWKNILNCMEEFKKKKLVKSIGISLAKNYLFEKKLLNEFDYVVDEFNLLRSNNYQYFQSLKSIFVSRSIFANGLLAHNNNKYRFSKKDHRHSWFKEKRKKIIYLQLGKLHEIFGKDLKDAAYDYNNSYKFIKKFIIGVRKKEHIDWLIKKIKTKEKINISCRKKVLELNNKYFNLDKNLIY
tara:strand:+ start:389 stop:1288 length:900 start_codon:yes stop_codon:yes gene_type:complete